MKNSGVLTVVATPIGNLGDMSPRALRVLTEADLIAAEDTRNTGQMLQRLAPDAFGGRWLSLHKFNEAEKQNVLLRELRDGKKIALVSDAGTPCISDPGFFGVRAAVEAGFTVNAVAGPCAAAAALSIAGLPAERFTFLGFLPRKAAALRELLATHAARAGTVVFYESPNRITDTLALLPDTARLCLCNDLTKRFERTYRGTPAQVLAELAENPNAGKGEYTGVVHFPEREAAPPEAAAVSPEGLLADAMAKENISLKEAVRRVADAHGLRKKDVYDAALRLKSLLG